MNLHWLLFFLGSFYLFFVSALRRFIPLRENRTGGTQPLLCYVKVQTLR